MKLNSLGDLLHPSIYTIFHEANITVKSDVKLKLRFKNYGIFFGFQEIPRFFYPLSLILPIDKLDLEFVPLDCMHQIRRYLCRTMEVIVSIKKFLFRDR